MKKKLLKPAAVKPERRANKKRPAAGYWVSETEMTQLRENLREAQETLEAIRSGEVDAVVVTGAKGSQIYSLTGAEQPYRIYVERMQEGAVTVGADGLILYCNQRFADMVQAALERVIGSSILDHLAEISRQNIFNVLNSAEEVIKQECRLKRGGGELPIHLTASRLPIENQNVICLVVTDLTAQKKHEELRLAKELAEKASHAKDDFLAALSHELRTPLTPVLMEAAALEQDETLPPAARQSLAMIRLNVELEARLIDDLLDLTRIARGKMALNSGRIDFHAIIHRALEVCRSEFNAKNQQIVLKLEARHFLSEGDSVRIQQALWNLIRNAAKFTPEKGSIIIRTGNPSAGNLSVEISDTGIGFQPGSEEKLFLAFEQGGQHITRRFGGLGLGLAITHFIIEAHGGKIRGHSDGAGKGATFTFEVPLRQVKRIHVKKTAPPAARAEDNTGKRILLVEDHEATRTSLETLLRKDKHEVKSAASSGEALKLASEQEFDFVISDIGLPDQSGLELMKQLHDQFGLMGIELSGYGMEEDIARGVASGFAHHLTKPVRFDQLKRVISQM
jgi:PAS domain S-box-containing protein